MPAQGHDFDISTFLKNLPHKPGVYRMLDRQGKVIYVGKAKNLLKRVSSYFQKNITHPKTRALVANIASVETTITNSENEALILENNLIKQYRPKYNVLFRDDKSYPYILLSEHIFPQLSLYRGSKKKPGEYFGPFPSVVAARHSLNLLQKLFRIRQCRDSFFKNRSRPCLQYQINRCTAPCVGYISPNEYEKDVNYAKLILQGKSSQVVNQLVTRMEQSSKSRQYEQAAFYRDQIAKLRQVQEQQFVTSKSQDIDVVGIKQQGGISCIQLLFFRGGQLIGNKAYFPKIPADASSQEVLQGFLEQYYLLPTQQHNLPKKIILSEKVVDAGWLVSTLEEQSQKKIQLVQVLRGESKQWVDMALKNASQALAQKLHEKTTLVERFEELQLALELEQIPEKIECFDISHSSGEATKASCVVFDRHGPLKQEYRTYKIKNITPGDDYAAMHQVLTRRYKHLKSEELPLPDLVMIDGGKGQLSQAQKAMEELQLQELQLVSIAKGEGRKPGLERLFFVDRDQPLILGTDSKALHLLQQIRDEAHRFAITGHRKSRDKQRQTSILESIEGVGAKRRRTLLSTFGGLQGLKNATIPDLAKTPGISLALAKKIHDALHES